MDVVVEESETEYPSFSMKKRGEHKQVKRSDSEFDQVVDQVLEENKSHTPRRDDLSDEDDDDSDLDADR
mgnify:CR=1 FL=1